uniref:Calmodulin-binding transcription activator 5 isoform X3 n=1 Tax=Rhizophora mucronata TaxID=61149 RepID=A0A2P2LW90_RHIMU
MNLQFHLAMNHLVLLQLISINLLFLYKYLSSLMSHLDGRFQLKQQRFLSLDIFLRSINIWKNPIYSAYVVMNVFLLKLFKLEYIAAWYCHIPLD